MNEVQKPITMLMDEFKSKFIDLLNNSQLPAWILLYILDPYIKQLQQFDEAAKEQDRQAYEEALNSQSEESTETMESEA